MQLAGMHRCCGKKPEAGMKAGEKTLTRLLDSTGRAELRAQSSTRCNLIDVQVKIPLGVRVPPLRAGDQDVTATGCNLLES